MVAVGRLLLARRHQRRSCGRRSRCAAAGTGFGKSKDKGGSEARKPLIREALQLAVKGDVDGLREFALNNMKRFDQDFWIAIAEEVDTTESEEGKERLRQLADSLMRVVEDATRTVEKQIVPGKELCERIIMTALDEKGVATFPLPEQKAKEMVAMIEKNFDAIDEVVIGTAFVVMETAAKDKVDDMVGLVQFFLTTYAGMVLSKRMTEYGDATLSRLLCEDPKDWKRMLLECARSGSIREDAFKERMQMTMEELLFSFPVGSYSQRLFAEFIKKFEEEGVHAFEEMKSSTST